jgi:hypothetical protein
MDDLDSSSDSAAGGTNDGDANAGQTDGQTTAASESQPTKSSESERIRGLQAAMGRKESEKQAALAERDAAVSALAGLQAEYDAFMQSPDEPAAVTDSDSAAAVDAANAAASDGADEEEDSEPDYTAPMLRANSGMASVTPSRNASRPRLSEADAALREMEQIMADSVAGYRD